MSDNCNSCGFPIDSDSHIYNVNCPASNAEYDQLLAEVAEAQVQAIEPELLARGREVVAEQIAFMRFVRDCRPEYNPRAWHHGLC